MAISVVRLGSPRKKNEGLRIGTVRRPPRGIKKEDYSRRHIFDVWFPNLSPTQALLKEFFPMSEQEWPRFRQRFMAEMKAPGRCREVELLAALSHRVNFSVGCYCEEESLCHRSLLRELLERAGADMA